MTRRRTTAAAATCMLLVILTTAGAQPSGDEVLDALIAAMNTMLASLQGSGTVFTSTNAGSTASGTVATEVEPAPPPPPLRSPPAPVTSTTTTPTSLSTAHEQPGAVAIPGSEAPTLIAPTPLRPSPTPPPTSSRPGSPATPGTLRSYATIYSLGVEWNIVGDGDHEATATVQYRPRGDTVWQPALPLVRVDGNGRNMLAGSIFDLEPGTVYEVQLDLRDPKGSSASRLATVATRPLPVLPTGGRTLHVTPGNGSGDGSAASPFGGIPAAQAAAQPGDVLLLHAGIYPGRTVFSKSGTPSRYLAWKAAGDGEVLLAAGFDVAASHVWIEGVTVRDQALATSSKNAPTNVVITRCVFRNNDYSIYLQDGGTGWYIADNDIIGATAPESESLVGEGIELNYVPGGAPSHGHTVAHNLITRVADGISAPGENVDIVGNDIFDTADDGIETDNGLANVRIWGNRIHNSGHNAISFQPQASAPWYILRNQIVGFREAPFKFRQTDRFVAMHNTIVRHSGPYICCEPDDLLHAITRNNLWVLVEGGSSQLWSFGPATGPWRTDLDYDGFDTGGSSGPFRFAGVTYTTLTAFASASGLQANGREIPRSCFESMNVPGQPPSAIPPQLMTLASDCLAVDAGVSLPNINTSHVGMAPDLGAYELGGCVRRYGPRPVGDTVVAKVNC